MKIVYNEKIIGFMYVNISKESKIVQLDYFAIFKEYREHGYGKKAINALIEMFKNYSGIYIEIEKIGLGDDELENLNRERRARFYNSIGFKRLDFDIELFKVIYTPYFFFIDYTYDKNKFIEEILQIYYSITPKYIFDKNFKILD